MRHECAAQLFPFRAIIIRLCAKKLEVWSFPAILMLTGSFLVCYAYPNFTHGGITMKNRLFKLFAFALAVMMLVVSVPSPVSAASACTHENAAFHHYSYEYEVASASNHKVNTWSWKRCPDCGLEMGQIVSSRLEAHSLGTAEFTGNHYHSGINHIYETASTCKTCGYVKYGKVSYPCSGDGINCPIIKG